MWEKMRLKKDFGIRDETNERFVRIVSTIVYIRQKIWNVWN
jgi:hypothetical protein